MGRACGSPLFASDPDLSVFVGKGLNVQASYMLPKTLERSLTKRYPVRGRGDSSGGWLQELQPNDIRVDKIYSGT